MHALLSWGVWGSVTYLVSPVSAGGLDMVIPLVRYPVIWEGVGAVEYWCPGVSDFVGGIWLFLR